MREAIEAIAAPPSDLASTNGLPGTTDAEDLSVSWDRCARLHRLNPLGGAGPDILAASETRQLREPLERTIATAQEELERLHARVRPIGYATLLADPGGVIVERHCRAADAEPFGQRGSRPGARWAEATEGTNGIGTCIVEQRPLSVHRQQHFRQRYAQLSCSGAPIFDAQGRLSAVLTLASYAPALSDHSYALALAVAVDAARAIEEREFRELNRARWVLALEPADLGGAALLLALDADLRIAAADRNARRTLALDDAAIARGAGIRDLFDFNPALLKGSGWEDLPLRLARRGDAGLWQGLGTPPESSGAMWRSPVSSQLHTRPRIALLSGLRHREQPTPPCGGLSPGALRRVREHIEAHLDQKIRVTDLARIAGLSTPHFSRAFKRGLGVAPQQYAVRQRIGKATRLLRDTDLKLSEIAQAAGFADQSHFAKCFARITGTSPSAFRRAHR